VPVLTCACGMFWLSMHLIAVPGASRRSAMAMRAGSDGVENEE
jgi:hypothetical protein